MICVNRHNGDVHGLQKVETFEFTTAAIHTQGKKAYSNTTPYRACVSARMPGCCDDVAGMGYGLHTPSLNSLFSIPFSLPPPARLWCVAAPY